MKKLISIFLIIACIMANSVLSFAYNDVNDDYKWCINEINYLNEKNIINGYEDGSFKPQNNVTRGELSKILCQSFSLKGETTYVDVKKTDWFYDFVSKTDNLFLTSNKFYPNDYATREEVAFAIYKAKNLKPSKNEITFTDSKDIKNEYKDAIATLLENKIITGYEDNTFKPKNNVLRSELCVMVYKILNLKDNTENNSDNNTNNNNETNKPNIDENVVDKDKLPAKAWSNFVVVTGVSIVSDAKTSTPITKIVGYDDGELVDIVFDYDTIDYVGNNKIKTGDVLVCFRDYYGKILTITNLLNIDNVSQYNSVEIMNFTKWANRKVVYGNVKRNSGGKVIELRNPIEDEKTLTYIINDNTHIYNYKNEKITLGNNDNILDASYGKGDWVIGLVQDDELMDMVVLKNK